MCSAKGQELHTGVKDWRLGTKGVWKFSQCPRCRLAWLNPQPIKEDIPKLYPPAYYTHTGEGVPSKIDTVRQYRLSTLLHVVPLVRDILLRPIMFIEKTAKGVHLDIGCGNGWLLQKTEALGWEGIGIEPDEKAAKAARDRGIAVIDKPIEDAGIADSSIDLITMRHVIEHAFDPLALLQECRRVLKPGGTLILVTPNIESLGHKVFKKYWRDLDTPRHLYLFSSLALKNLAEKGGLTVQVLRTLTPAAYNMWMTSAHIKKRKAYAIKHRTMAMKLKGMMFMVLEECVRMAKGEKGEELLVIAAKPDYPAPPAKENISAVIVAHDPQRDIIKEAAALAAQVDAVVIVDNASQNNAALVRTAARVNSNIVLISNRENAGQAKALNQGVGWAANQHYQWILLMDHDSLPAKDMVSEQILAYLEAFAQGIRADLIGVNFMYRDTGKHAFPYECGGKTYIHKRNIGIQTSGSLLSLHAYQRVGPFCEYFFIDYIDTEYCIRLQKKKFNTIIACKARMLHTISNRYAGMRRYYRWRNWFIIAIKHPLWAIKNFYEKKNIPRNSAL
ncbi:MAG: methyltransferase domain-containing protein [Candidatus Portnoybacteria bacterium]|nr:methyltransferase domain-containing protein [Candidatus Portnoybacteria bacterium]